MTNAFDSMDLNTASCRVDGDPIVPEPGRMAGRSPSRKRGGDRPQAPRRLHEGRKKPCEGI